MKMIGMIIAATWTAVSAFVLLLNYAAGKRNKEIEAILITEDGEGEFGARTSVNADKICFEEQMQIGTERLAKEYLSKVKCCDECFCEYWCIENGAKKSRVPYKGCERNIIKRIAEIQNAEKDAVEMSEEMRLKLEGDCNSLNAISSMLRHEGKNKAADCLLAIESHIFKLIDDIFADIYNG